MTWYMIRSKTAPMYLVVDQDGESNPAWYASRGTCFILHQDAINCLTAIKDTIEHMTKQLSPASYSYRKKKQITIDNLSSMLEQAEVVELTMHEPMKEKTK